MPILCAGQSDIGRKRKTNQDAIFCQGGLTYFLVADGMGGHNGGDIASAIATASFEHYLEEQKKAKRQDDPNILVEAFKEANREIFNKSQLSPELHGMGTTMVGFFFIKSTVYVGNVGDSRAYLFSKDKLYQLTRDHSLVQEKLNLGMYNRDQAQADPKKNVLVRTIGFEPEVEVDVFTYKVSRYDLLLLCSDGLHGKVSDRDIHYIISKNIQDPKTTTEAQLENCVSDLIANANANGGQDNISVVICLAK